MATPKNGLDEINVSSRLLNMVLDMPTEKQLELLALMDQWAHKGARQHARKPWKIAVEYTNGKQVYRDYITDISNGGVFIETQSPFTVGQIIKMKFPLPNYQKIVKVIGVIVWSSSQGIGIKFKKHVSKDP